MNDQSVPEHGIAVVGRAGRFPAARNVSDFWDMLAAKRTATTWLSDGDLLAAGVSRRALADPNYVKAAQILPGMDRFDAGFWGFSPRDAQILDPQHRHFLETSWEALEDAGHMPEDFDGRVGVFAGSGMQAYMAFNLLSNPALVDEIGLFLLRHTGNDKDFLPTRLSYLLNLTGPSVAVQTACSTSLVAVHMGVNSLLNMECDMAIAGGVTIELPHNVGYRYEPGEILSPDGLCRAFDDDSQGTVFGSGAAVVVLRRLADALADGDDIKAVILGSAINNDGAGKASYLAPSVDGQAEAAAEAVAIAGVEPASISYIEAHGTGTPIGDPIELSALGEVYAEAAPGSIGIGSVKTNIGHLDTAAGAASLIKVVEAMRHKTLPASLHFNTPNSRYDWSGGPFNVVSDTRPWDSAGPRRAAINSLGVGGTNAHVVVQEAPARSVPHAPTSEGWRLYPFSARTHDALERTAEKWAGFLADPDAPAGADIAFTLREGRRKFPERMAVAADSHAALSEGMGARVTGARQSGTAAERPPRIVFLFPGGGAQYPGAGSEMMAAEPVFAEAVEACFAALPDLAPEDLREMMFDRDLSDTEARDKLGQSDYAIPALFILEYAYARLWQSWGITPDMIFAHSVGEYAAAVVAGAMGLEDAMAVVSLRGRVMEDAPKGAMTTIPFCAEAAGRYLGEDLDIAAINSAHSTVVSGRLPDIEALEARLEGEGHDARRIHIDVAAHSRQLDGQLERFRDGFEGVTFSEPTIPMVSSLRGGPREGDDFTSADYWVRHLRHTVRFTDAMQAALSEPDCVVIEVGPGQTLGPLVEAADLAHPPRAILPSAPRPRDDDHEMAVALAAAGGLWTQGWPLDFARLPGGAAGRRVSMPTYAFDQTRHWIAPGQGASATAEDAADEVLLLERIADPANWIEALGWDNGPALPAAALSGTRWLVLAGDDPVSDAALAALREGGAHVVTARQGAGFANGADGIVLNPGMPEDFEALVDALPEPPTHILSLWGLGDEAPFGAVYLLARALQLADAGAGCRMVLAAPAGRAEAAALLGPVRVAPREVPGLSAALVELSAPADAALVPALIAEALADGTTAPDHVRLGPEGTRALRRRAAAPHGGAEGLPARLRQGGIYVLTGGSGGIGQQMARWLVEVAGAKVALLSRSATEDPALEAEIADLGGALMHVAADVTDHDSLAAALDAVRARFGEITGVIHGAGRIDDRPLSSKSLTEAEAVLAPKLTGARHLDTLLPEGSVDLFCVISSSSVVIGGAGQADYAGANAALEALAAARADGLSIAWGVWRDTGMAAREYGAGEEVAAPPPGQRHDDAGGVIRFETRLDPDSDWRLTGHLVAGQPIFPGTGFMDLAYAGARAIWPDGPITLDEVSFEEAMSFADGLPRRVTLQLEPEGDGYAASILSRVGPEDPVRHVSLRLRAAAETPSPPESLVGPAPDTQVEDLHQAVQEGLIDFGPRWKALQDLHLSPDGTIAEGRFVLAPDFVADLDAHPLHPALLDMAWTVGLSVLPEAERSGVVYVPMSLGGAHIAGPLPANVTARAVRTGGEPGRLARFAVSLTDATGQVVAVLEDFALWAVPGGALAAETDLPPLTTQLLATGIRKTEAADVFARVFDHPECALIVSPVSLDLVRLAMEEIPMQAEDGAQGSGGEIDDPVTAQLATIWSEILGVTGIGPEDEFFALGGHSLNAVRMFGRVKRDMGVSLPIATLFDAPTLSALADVVAAEGGLDRSTPTQDAGAAPSAAAGAAVLAEDVPAPQARRLPMTIGQREIAAALLVDPEAARGYNLSFSLEVPASVDTWALQGALRDLALRHDVLRATVDLEDLALDIAAEVNIPLETADLSHLTGPGQAAARDALVAEQGGRLIDLAHGPVFRALAIRLGPTQSEIVLCYHHLLCDGWSTATVLRDLVAFYAARTAGTAPNLPALQPIDDLIAAEADWDGSTEAQAHRAYWHDLFADGVPVMELPLDRPRTAHTNSQAGQVVLRLPPDLEAALRRRARAAGVTPAHVIFAAYNLLLSRILGETQTVLGLPNAGQLVHGLDSVVAHSVNFLCPVFEADPKMTTDGYLTDVYRRLVMASDHQGYAYADLVRDLQVPRDPARIPIVPVVVNIDNLASETITLDGQPLGIRVNPAGHEHFEIFFNIWDGEGRVELTWSYLSDLFSDAAIALQADTMAQLLAEICDRPGDAPLSDLLRGRTDVPASGSFNDPGAAGPQDIAVIFRDVAARFRDKIALRFGDVAMDYATLDARSDALAGTLAARGIGPGDLVGIPSERRPELVIAVLGALKAGAGYVPFDTALPEARLRFMAEDTGIKLLLGRLDPVEACGVPVLGPEHFPQDGAAPDVANAPDAASYVMFTSGTTGTPKAVVQTHRSVVRLLIDTDWIDLGPETVTLHSSAFAFDTSIIDIFGALLHGGTLVLPPPGQLSIGDLSDAIESHRVNTLWLTSGLFHAVADTRPDAFAQVGQVIVGGDVVSPVHVGRVMEACPELIVINGFGPTETHVITSHRITAEDVASGAAIPIGRAIAGTQIFLVDANGWPVPPGIPGEIVAVGRGVANGYWNRPELTAEKFGVVPWDPDLRLYRTGDLGMDPGTGVIRFFGRIDTQVKIRGFRVELGEIESTLEAHPGVGQAVVSAILPEGQTDRILVAHVVAEDPALTVAALQAHLRTLLPEFAQPSALMLMEALPLNQNGKVDRRQLPAPMLEDTAGGPPETETEIRLAKIWCEILGMSEIGTTTSFFALGGHSLLAVRLFDRIRSTFGVDLPISTLFQHQTLRDLARHLDDMAPAQPVVTGAGAAGQTPGPTPAAPSVTADVATAPDPDGAWDTSVVIHPGPAGTDARPFFIVGGIGGNVNNLFILGQRLGQARSVIGFQTRGVMGHRPLDNIPAMAEDNIRYLRTHQPHGPYLIAGYSGGALTAHEMVRQLEAAGEMVERFVVLDTFAPGFATNFVPNVKTGLWWRIKNEVSQLRDEGLSVLATRSKAKLATVLARGPLRGLVRHVSLSHYRYEIMRQVWIKAARGYDGGPISAPVSLFKTSPVTPIKKLAFEADRSLGWKDVVPDGAFELIMVPGDHRSMLTEPHVDPLSEEIAQALTRTQATDA
ncbi:non-ribosomal peptide synthetase/type I polyketide synthase [Gymnodinialimonas ulvae]|uniref:non-ribosomal peptide synthetase/type I polyketide synthase n=1 Tax=Gymnodinialimonas ulvae TaxID=3126504 RepID=UPI00309B3803